MKLPLRESKRFADQRLWHEVVAAVSLASLGVIVAYLVVGQ